MQCQTPSDFRPSLVVAALCNGISRLRRWYMRVRDHSPKIWLPVARTLTQARQGTEMPLLDSMLLRDPPALHFAVSNCGTASLHDCDHYSMLVGEDVLHLLKSAEYIVVMELALNRFALQRAMRCSPSLLLRESNQFFSPRIKGIPDPTSRKKPLSLFLGIPYLRPRHRSLLMQATPRSPFHVYIILAICCPPAKIRHASGDSPRQESTQAFCTNQATYIGS